MSEAGIQKPSVPEGFLEWRQVARGVFEATLESEERAFYLQLPEWLVAEGGNSEQWGNYILAAVAGALRVVPEDEMMEHMRSGENILKADSKYYLRSPASLDVQQLQKVNERLIIMQTARARTRIENLLNRQISQEENYIKNLLLLGILEDEAGGGAEDTKPDLVRIPFNPIQFSTSEYSSFSDFAAHEIPKIGEREARGVHRILDNPQCDIWHLYVLLPLWLLEKPKSDWSCYILETSEKIFGYEPDAIFEDCYVKVGTDPYLDFLEDDEVDQEEFLLKLEALYQALQNLEETDSPPIKGQRRMVEEQYLMRRVASAAPARKIDTSIIDQLRETSSLLDDQGRIRN